MDNPQAAEEMLASDPLTWGQFFFPNHFRTKTPVFHLELLNAVYEFNKVAVASPRRSAKSTLLLFLFPFHQIMFRKSRFIVIISNTFKKASMHLDTIKKELMDNQKLKEFHPKITMPRDAEGDTIFRHANGFETLVLCKGVDQIGSLRGVKFGAYRPDLILGDDMEDDSLVRNPDLRLKLQEDFDSVLTPIGGDLNTRHVYVGTILHDDCQLAKLVSREHYPEYLKLFYKAHLNPDTPEETSLWPENWTVDFLRQLRKDKPNVYAKEYQNDPVAGSNTRFQRSDFRYWKIEGNRVCLMAPGGNVETSYALTDCRAAISCDLAWKEKRDSDSSVIMPGLLTPASDILIETYINKKAMRPDELAEQLFLMVDRLEAMTKSSVPVGFEKSMLENVSQWLLKREMRKRNKFLTVKQLAWDNDKNTRIETRLQPRYSQHVIYHKTGMGDLEHQLERFPFGAHDDLIDAEQGLVQLLQFPKEASAIPQQVDEFEWWREQAIQMRKPHQYEGKTGAKKRGVMKQIPFRKSWR